MLVKKSIPDWHLFITQMETKWTKWYAMTSHVIAYGSLELLFGMHTFHFNCFLRILIAHLRKYAAYLGCWIQIKSPYCSISEMDIEYMVGHEKQRRKQFILFLQYYNYYKIHSCPQYCSNLSLLGNLEANRLCLI